MSTSLNPPLFSPYRWLFAAAMSFAGAVAFSYILAQGLGAKSWIETKAMMTTCELLEGRKGKQQLLVRYDYTFEDKAYTGTKFGFTDGASKEEWATRYAAGRAVVCFVNPKDPTQAMLRRDMGVFYWFLPGGFLAAAAGLGYGAKRAFTQKRIADAATLYSLESHESSAPAHRKAA